jgi:hypothetical protein
MLDRTMVPVSFEVMVSVARLTKRNIGCANTLDAEVSEGTCPFGKGLLLACSTRREYSHERSGLVFPGVDLVSLRLCLYSGELLVGLLRRE